nr:hypothetical protein [uncultured Methanobacterium sp.]
MKPIFRDNMCMGNIKEELFFETLFLISLIKKQLLMFTIPLGSITHCSITNFNYLYHTHYSVSHPLTVSHLISKLNTGQLLILQCILTQQYIPPEAKHGPGYS